MIEGIKHLRFCVAFLLLSAGTALAAEPFGVVEARGGLPHVFRRLRAGEPVTIAYLGASITNGAGASDGAKTSWRALTTAWFRSRFPKVGVTEVSENSSGLGSPLGAFRVRRDVLSRKPDLIFVEYAVNDVGTSEERISRAMEGIVRQIRTDNPTADICFVYSLYQAMLDDYRSGHLPQSIKLHEQVASRYDIPAINFGLVAARRLLNAELKWDEFSKDVCHPTDLGYRLFARTLSDFLEEESRRERPLGTPKLPEPLRADCWQSVAMIGAAETLPKGWSLDTEHGGNSLPKLAACDTPGAKYTFRFSGDTIGIYAEVGPDTGKTDYRIDEGEWKTFSPFQYDFHHLYHGATYLLISDTLPAGPHTLTLRVRDDKDPRSQGRWTRIGYFLVNQARQ